MSLHSSQYSLGCPIWSNPKWVGRLFARKSKQSDWLRQYSQVFSTVEGNSTFYGLPQPETVQKWAEQTHEGFTFSLKFPRVISHEKQLLHCESELTTFLELLEILHRSQRLGPSFLQLAPTFSGREFPQLAAFLQSLPKEYPYAVEVRHLDYYDEKEHEIRLNQLLAEFNIDRVLVDSRPLFAKRARTQYEQISQGRKPRVPVRKTVTGSGPFVRLIGRDQVADLQKWSQSWARITAGWIREGLRPYLFTHTPDDSFAIDFARLFHNELRLHLPEIPPLPAWPGEVEAAKLGEQRTLF